MTAFKMKNMYVGYDCDNRVWDMFYMMYVTGLISDKSWDKFFKECRSYQYDGTNVIDGDGNIVKPV